MFLVCMILENLGGIKQPFFFFKARTPTVTTVWGMTAENLETSAHFRANLGALDEAAVQVFSDWAEANCSRFVLREESGARVLYATRPSARSPQQHRNTLRALCSRNKIQLKTEAAFLHLLKAGEYEDVIDQDARAQTVAPEMQKASPQTCCKKELAPQISPDFDRRAEEMLAQLVAAGAR